jgi:hypothetical protein
MLGLQLERLRLLDEQIAKLNSLIAQAMKPHQDTVIRLAEVPGLGIDSAQQVIAEVGVTAATFSSAAEFTSWVGTCPGKEESAEENSSSRSAKGNKYLRRAFNQAAHAAARSKGTHFRRCSDVCCRASATNPLCGQSHIVYAAWSGRSFIKESASSSKASSQNQSFSCTVPNTSLDNFASSATTSRSLEPTLLLHKTHRTRSRGSDFRRSCRQTGNCPIAGIEVSVIHHKPNNQSGESG